MTNSYLFERFNRFTDAIRDMFSARLLPVSAALAAALVLAPGLLPGGAASAQAQEVAAAQVATVNINTADAATLSSGLKGVGNARATEIVRYREAYGPFKSVDELAEVKGIGKSTLDENRALITLE